MPLYEYRPTHGSGCPQCEDGLVVLQKLHDAALAVCPDCQAPLNKVISAPNVRAKGAPALTQQNIEQAGFTQYKKAGHGVYEKTAGRGPNVISRED